MDDLTEKALREIVTIVGRAFGAGCSMLSCDAEREIAAVLERQAARLHEVKVLAAEAYALEYPLHGRDVALSLMETGLLTAADFAALVREYDPDAADAILRPAEPCEWEMSYDAASF
jgi:hypothetical protein